MWNRHGDYFRRKKERKEKKVWKNGGREREWVSEWVSNNQNGKRIGDGNWKEDIYGRTKAERKNFNRWYEVVSFFEVKEKKKKEKKGKKKHEECRKRILKKGIEGEIQTQEKLQYVKKKKHTKFKRKK